MKKYLSIIAASALPLFMTACGKSDTSDSGLPVWLIILITVAAVLVLIIIIIAVTASGNMKAINKVTDDAVDEVKSYLPVNPVPCGKFETITVYGIMKFHVEQYEVEGLGNLSIMKTNMGFMQMATFVLTPFTKNLPLISADYMYMMKKRTCYVEFYDLVENQDNVYKRLISDLKRVHRTYKKLKEVTPTPAWYDKLKTVGFYKSGKPADDEILEKMLLDGIDAVLDAGEKMHTLNEKKQQGKLAVTKKYSDGLITNGGVSTDVFKKSLGEETTREFFNTVFFGTDA